MQHQRNPRPPIDIEDPKQGRNVVFDRQGRDAEGKRNLLVGHATRHAIGDLLLARRQVVKVAGCALVSKDERCAKAFFGREIHCNIGARSRQPRQGLQCRPTRRVALFQPVDHGLEFQPFFLRQHRQYP